MVELRGTALARAAAPRRLGECQIGQLGVTKRVRGRVAVRWGSSHAYHLVPDGSGIVREGKPPPPQYGDVRASRKPSVRAESSNTTPESAGDESGFRALLDHLGRLLAQEYVDRLTGDPGPGRPIPGGTKE